jgi:hypothetical protein
MAVHEAVHVHQFASRYVAIASLVFAPVKALFLPHESIRILADFFPDFRMLLQIFLQRAVIFDKLLVIRQRRILAQLFCDFGMAVEKAVKCRKLLPRDTVVPVRGSHGLSSHAYRSCYEHGAHRQQNQTRMDKRVCAFHKCMEPPPMGSCNAMATAGARPICFVSRDLGGTWRKDLRRFQGMQFLHKPGKSSYGRNLSTKLWSKYAGKTNPPFARKRRVDPSGAWPEALVRS